MEIALVTGPAAALITLPFVIEPPIWIPFRLVSCRLVWALIRPAFMLPPTRMKESTCPVPALSVDPVRSPPMEILG